jgi:hypothetical protein
MIDHDALAEQLAHPIADHARDDRGAAARRERNHQRDRPRRIILRENRRGDACQQKSNGGKRCLEAHSKTFLDLFVGRTVVETVRLHKAAAGTAGMQLSISRQTPAAPARRRG